MSWENPFFTEVRQLPYDTIPQAYSMRLVSAESFLSKWQERNTSNKKLSRPNKIDEKNFLTNNVFVRKITTPT